MERVLIVSSAEQGDRFFRELLRSAAAPEPVFVRTGGEARRTLLLDTFELIVINAPLTDEYGHELAVRCCEATTAGVLLIVRADQADAVSHKVEASGAFVVQKPVSRSAFYRALRFVSAAHSRLRTLQDENNRLQQKILELRLVDRAKCVLIQYLNMTEPQAHRYIEKQAMDLRLPRREIAEEIIKTYEMV